MKNLKAGSMCHCIHGDCTAYLYQGPEQWGLMLSCGGDPFSHYSGSGQYGGTVCGGQCPHQL